MKPQAPEKKAWEKPVLTCYGKVEEITRMPNPPGKLPWDYDGNGHWPKSEPYS